MESIKTLNSNISEIQGYYEQRKSSKTAWKHFGFSVDQHGGITLHDREKFMSNPEAVLIVSRLHSYNGNDLEPSDELAELMRSMVANGRLSEIENEVFYSEVYWALTDPFPGNFMSPLLGDPRMEMIANLVWCPQRLDHHPEGDVYTHTLLAIAYANFRWSDHVVNFALLCHDLGKPDSWETTGKAHGHEETGLPYVDKLSRLLGTPKKMRETAHLVCKLHTKVHGVLGRNNKTMARPGTIVDIISEAKGLNGNPYLFDCFLNACEADAKGRGSCHEEVSKFHSKPYPQAMFLRWCADFLRELDVSEVKKHYVAKTDKKEVINRHVREFRASKLADFIAKEQKQFS